METRKCLECGKLFRPNSEAHHYCTEKCFDKAYADDDPYTPQARRLLIGKGW